MNLPSVLNAVVRWSSARPRAVVLGAIVLSLAGAALALRLAPDAGTDTLVGKGTPSAQATRTLHEKFGDDAVLILVRGELSKVLLTQDVERLLGLEGCISGNLPAGVKPRGGANGPCAKLAKTKPVKVVFGPGTFVNESVSQISDQFTQRTTQTQQRARQADRAARTLARKRGRGAAEQRRVGRQARELVMNEFYRDLLQLGLRYGLRAPPQLNDPGFVSTLVFDSSKPAGTPKERFAYLFPNRSTAVIQVRMKPDLTDAQRAEAIAQVRSAVAMGDWKPQNGARFTVTGAPVVVDDLTDSISRSLLILLVAALLVMAATLALVFSSRLRLLPLAIALGAAALTFGGLSLAGQSLTMASIACLPVLIGLAVDYAIQLQSRVEEARGEGLGAVAATRRAAALGAPTIATAAAATAAGFLVLVLSPVPMVRGFGLLLVVGIVVAFALALAVGTAAVVLAERSRPPRALRSLGARLGPAARGARDLLVANPVARRLRAGAGRGLRAALGAALRRPRRVLGIAAAVALLGWALDTQTRVESDIQKLVPQDLSSLKALDDLQRSTGVGGQIDVVVQGEDVTSPAAVGWMGDYQDRVLKRFGYSAERGCGTAAVCPAFSLPDLFETQQGTLTKARIDALLEAVPAYFSQSVIAPDESTATLAFGIRRMSLENQKEVMDEMRSLMAGAPEGVRPELAGLPVLAAEANARVSSDWRRLGTLLAGLLAVAAVLFAAFRRAERVLVPLVPIALATGWSALTLFVLRIPLNPMSVTLGALVIAISTEFSVLLAERYRAERAAGHPPRDALERTYRSTGAAVLASGVTAIAGFAVLVLSDIRMLRDFGFVTVIDLTVSLLGVLVVLPSVLVLAERGELFRLPGRPRLRRPRVRLRRPRLKRPRLRRRAGAPA